MALPARQDGRADDRRTSRAPAARRAPRICARLSSNPSSRISGRSARGSSAAGARIRDACPRQSFDRALRPAQPAGPYYRTSRRRAAAAYRSLAPGLARPRVRRAASRPGWTPPSGRPASGSGPSTRRAGEHGFRRLLDDPTALLAGRQHPRAAGALALRPAARRAAQAGDHRRRVPLAAPPARSARRGGLEIVRCAATRRVGRRAAGRGDRRPHRGGSVSTVFFATPRSPAASTPAGEACRGTAPSWCSTPTTSSNVVPFSLRRAGLDDAFVVGGGYKYCQLGEGNCFLRFPADCELRPVVTGWFAEFERPRPSRRQAASPTSTVTIASPAPPTIRPATTGPPRSSTSSPSTARSRPAPRP